MRLAQKAAGLLKGLSLKQIDGRRANGPDKDKAKPLNEERRLEELKRKRSSTAIATAPEKRRRNMARPAIAIHEDVQNPDRQPRQVRKMSTQLEQDDQSVQDESMSEETDSEEEPDESVMEDMKKLEESFEGISQRYRLINRIGEGQ